MSQICTVKYQIATYEGEITVPCHEDDDNDYIIAKAKRQLSKMTVGGLPYGYESFKIISRKEDADA